MTEFRLQLLVLFLTAAAFICVYGAIIFGLTALIQWTAAGFGYEWPFFRLAGAVLLVLISISILRSKS